MERAAVKAAAAKPRPLSTLDAFRRTATAKLGGGASVAHYASLPVGVVVLLWLARGQWFFYDEWDFLANRGTPLPGGTSLFTPHSEHWSTIPILVYHALQSAVGLRSYLPYMAVLILLHVLNVHLLWRISLRAGARPWLAFALCALFMLLGAGFENLLWAFQIGFIGSLTFGLVALLVDDRCGAGFSRWLVLEWAACVGALMCSGVGVTVVAVVGLVALFRRGVLAAAVAISVPALTFVVWFLAIGHLNYGNNPTPTDYLLLPDYIWLALTNTVDASTGLVGAGAVAVIGLAYWATTRGRHTPELAIPLAMASGVLVFFTISGLGRLYLGVGEGSSSRYVYVAAALALPLSAAGLSKVAQRGRITEWALLGVIAFCLVHSVGVLRAQARAEAVTRQESRGQILAAAQLLAQGVPVVSPLPDSQWAPNLTTTELRALAAAGQLPAANLSIKDELNGRYGLQVVWSATPVVPAQSTAVGLTTDGTVQARASDCARVSEDGSAVGVELQFDTPGSVSIALPADGAVQVQFAMGDDPMTRSDPHPKVVTGGQPLYLNVSQAGAVLRVTIPAPFADICGVQAG